MVQLLQPITTKRLILRRLERRDIDDLALIFADESVCRYLYVEPRDRDETRDALQFRLDMPEELAEHNVLNVAVELHGVPRLIGEFMLRWNDDEHSQGEIGGTLHPDYHGQGIASEVYGALLTLAFTQYDLHRVVGRCDARNVASIRSLEKAGLHEEAHFVENEFVKGEWTDEVIMAVLADQWHPAA